MTYRSSCVTVGDDSHTGVSEGTGSTTVKRVRADTYCHEQQTSADTPQSNGHITPFTQDHWEATMKAPDIKRRFIDKFFSERELVVEYYESDDSAAKEAHAWFKQVQDIIAKLPIYRHDNVGQPLENNESDVWFFRGQKDSSFAFTSTLYRRLLDAKTPKDYEKAMLKAELSLLDKARKIGIGRGLTALETLTLLQHHGSPTRLIDITSDWKVALFSSARATTTGTAACSSSKQIRAGGANSRKTKALPNDESFRFGATIARTFLTLKNGAMHGWLEPGRSCSRSLTPE